MLKPGEKVVSAVTHQDFVLVFGDRGTVIKMVHDRISEQPIIYRYAELDVK